MKRGFHHLFGMAKVSRVAWLEGVGVLKIFHGWGLFCLEWMGIWGEGVYVFGIAGGMLVVCVWNGWGGVCMCLEWLGRGMYVFGIAGGMVVVCVWNCWGHGCGMCLEWLGRGCMCLELLGG